MKNLKTKTTLLSVLFILSIISINAQINFPKKNIPTTIPNLNKMDPLVKEMVYGADEGTYKLTMASLALEKEAPSRSSHVGSRSFASTTPKGFFELKKKNVLTVRCKFIDKATNSYSYVTIYSKLSGGQYVKIQHKKSNWNKPLKNVKIIKKGLHRFIITAEGEDYQGTVTNYIFNIFRYVIQ